MKSKSNKEKKPFYKRWWFIVIVLFVVIGSIGGDDEKESEKEKDKPVAVKTEKKEDEKVEKNVKSEKEESLDVKGALDITFKDNKAIATITTNAIDGSIFETTIMDGNINMVTGFLEVKDGKAVKEFEANKDWEVGYLSSIASMRFNLDEHPQPEQVKKAYGEHGENLKGDFIIENNVGGNNLNLESKTIAYPDEITLKAKQTELFDKAMNELIGSSGGVIVNIQPRFEKDDWSAVSVIVSDVWYNSQDHEKERFAEQVGETVSTLVTNGGKVEPNKAVLVYVMDTYNKELASPKVLGGYKIKK